MPPIADADAAEYAAFTQAVAPVMRVHLEDYKPRQMERRVRDLARKHQAATLREFGAMVRDNQQVLHELEQHVTINVSEFFRNPDAFERLRRDVLPALLDSQRGLRLWSAGCSYGAEPFSLAMILHEDATEYRHSVVASDIDPVMLARARSGRGFTRDDVRHLPEDLRRRYLSADGPPFAVRPEIVRAVRFVQHDLLSGPIARTFDLIACRNVIIYFAEPAKRRLVRSFVDSLRPGGYLFMGATESIAAATQLGLRYVAPGFYQKVA